MFAFVVLIVVLCLNKNEKNMAVTKYLWVVSETDAWNRSATPIAYCTSKKKAMSIIRALVLSNVSKKLLQSDWGGIKGLMEFVSEQLQTQGFDVNYNIDVEVFNELI